MFILFFKNNLYLSSLAWLSNKLFLSFSFIIQFLNIHIMIVCICCFSNFSIIIQIIPQFLNYHYSDSSVSQLSLQWFLSFLIIIPIHSSVSQLSLQVIPHFLKYHFQFLLSFSWQFCCCALARLLVSFEAMCLGMRSVTLMYMAKHLLLS